MKSRFLVLFICLLATVAIVGCDLFGSDDDNNVTSSGTISGKIFDSVATTTPIIATVTDGSQTTTSLADGSYTLTVTPGANGKVKLTVTNANYLTGYAFEPVTAGQTTTANVYLISKAGAEQKAPANLTLADATLNFQSKVAIKLPKNSVINANGPVATPTVTVVYKAPPKTAAAMDVFPGVFAGVPTNGTTEVPFETFGFVNIDLGEGNSLDPAIGASLTIPLGANNPTTGAYALAMPLWRFDTSDGKWKQVATATRADTNANTPFSANVTTFSWYNLDAPVNVSRLDVVVSSYTSTLKQWDIMEGIATDTDRSDLTKRTAGARVIVTATAEASENNAQWGTQAYDDTNNFTWREAKLTDSNGVASFNIPSGRKFSIKVVTSTAEKSGYMYEVVNSIATAYINMGSFNDQHGEQGTMGIR